MLRRGTATCSRLLSRANIFTNSQRLCAPAAIGIDLGTTNTAAAWMQGNEPKILENSEGARTTPSVVAFKGNQTLVGIAAKRQAVTNPENTFAATKRFMGRPYSDFTDAQKKKVPYKLVERDNGDCWFETSDGRQFSPQQIAAIILEKMKATAEDHLGKKVQKAVITVPAYFNETQKRATKDAGVIAGLEVLRIINEPTSAALAYGFNKDQDDSKTVAVYDLGGGTFDVSIMEIAGGVFEVKSTNGDTYLGGEDFENALTEHILSEFRKEHGINLTDKVALQRIREAAENAKIELSSTNHTEISLPYITSHNNQTLNIQLDLSRSKFEALTEGIVQRTVPPCRQALKDAKISASEVDEVILVGGMTRMPKVVETVKKTFGKDPVRSVNPDEAVAMGAAVQAGILLGEMDDVVLLDVTPLALGIETLGGVFTRIIPANTQIPTVQKQTFSTAEDSQSTVGIRVFQGDREFANDNKCLGEFSLTGIPPAPRGVPQIQVSFAVDANGIMNVTAKDQATGKDASIQLVAQGGLSKAEIEAMQREAQERKQEDVQRREKIDAINQADQAVHQANKAKDDLKDIPDDKLSTLDSTLQRVKDVLANQENYGKRQIEEAVQDLNKALYAVTSAQYQQPGGGRHETTEA
eukprot:TRINITY_DN65050_c0_g1_i1.p1 TRINITY_DN65050_c0_g1~~TRINITY_DN65050_c0_g1_i1.p1  ORF type:complete len:658 (+),score=108.88 TRINITY_DN65050_c0_g1_i1:55-1974(+)